MAEVLGPMTIVSRALPTGVDGAKVAQWQMAEGTTFQAFINELSLAVGSFNQQLMTDWGWLFAITEDLVLEYVDGGSVTELPEITDIDTPDMVQGQTIGHMIDLKAYGGAVGGSWMYWRDARRAQIEAAIRTIVWRAQWRFEKALLKRFFLNTENSIGSVGYDVPFVRGTGGAVDFTPPAYAGQSFDTSHDHYLGIASGSVALDVQLNQMAETLEEHGHRGPYRAIVARDDVATYRALTSFVQFAAPQVLVIDRGGTSSGAQYFARGEPMVSDGLFGHFQSDYGLIELFATARVPTTYAGLCKSYGTNDQRNPLKVRVHPQAGFGFYIVPEASGNDQWPVKRVTLPFEFGVSVGQDRTNGVAAYRSAGGSWSNPTIS